nr:MAG TPA: Ragulator complex protein [Bacteriophage sp.]
MIRCTNPGMLSGPRNTIQRYLIFLSGSDYLITISNDLGVGRCIWLLRVL